MLRVASCATSPGFQYLPACLPACCSFVTAMACPHHCECLSPAHTLHAQRHASGLALCCCSAVIDVIAALASHGSATAVAAAQQQSSSSIDAADLVYETYAILFTGACHLTCTIRDSGQMARLSDADALRFGSALSLAVRGMPGVWLLGVGGGWWAAAVYLPCMHMVRSRSASLVPILSTPAMCSAAARLCGAYPGIRRCRPCSSASWLSAVAC